MSTMFSDIHVCLVGDFKGSIPSGTQIVQTDADYVRAAQIIRDCVEQKKAANIWVRKKAHYSWLQTYVGSVALDVDFKEKTPRLILADMWEVTIPDWLKDEHVIAQNLLNLRVPENHPADFMSTLLSALLGKHFCKDQIVAANIPGLLQIASPKNQALLEKYPALADCFEKMCLKWMDDSSNTWVEEICTDLQIQPESLWHDLSLWVLLCDYPEKLLKYELPPHRIALVQKLSPEKLVGMELHVVAVDEASRQAKLFFNDIGPQVETTEDLEKVVACCSGKLHIEFVSLMQIIQTDSSLVQEIHLENIRQKFTSCPGVSTADLIKLNKVIAPNIPTALSAGQNWEATNWINWTLNEYIQYRQWLTENKGENLILEETVAAFSDWYVENYSVIHQDINTSLVHALTSWNDRIRNDELSLVIVIDCLPLTYFDLLLKAFSVGGFHKHGQGVRFAPLPSNTETCKPLLISGDWHGENNADYGKIVDRRVELNWPEKKAIYLSNLQAMTSTVIPNDQPLVYFLNYTPSDDVMHSNPGLKGMTYDDELFNCFTKLAEAAQSFLQRSQKDGDLVSVYVITDHGAARILESERKSFDSIVIHDLFENSKHRFAVIDHVDADRIPDNLWDIGYRFTQPFGESNHTYFIPRGHKTAGVKKAAQGYVHGGATPEEIIVPVAVFKIVESKLIEPQGRFVGIRLDPTSKSAVFHIQRIEGIEIAVQNPNPESLQIIRAEIVTPEASQIREFHLFEIPANSEKQFDVKCYFNKGATGDNELLLRFIYKYGEEERELVLPLKSIFKTAITGGFSLKNL